MKRIFITLLLASILLTGCTRPRGNNVPARPTSLPAQPTSAPPTAQQIAAGGYIDAHMHLDGVYMSAGTRVMDYETAADNLIALMDQYDVDKALIMEMPEVRYSDLLPALEKYPDRFMIGGDEFVGIPGLTPNRPQSFEETWPILAQLPHDLAQQVGREYAARVYHLDE